jgi:hypothetical protein
MLSPGDTSVEMERYGSPAREDGIMSAFEKDCPKQMPAKRLQFDRYVLDLD